jgi:hypothetical protein
MIEYKHHNTEGRGGKGPLPGSSEHAFFTGTQFCSDTKFMEFSKFAKPISASKKTISSKDLCFAVCTVEKRMKIMGLYGVT